MTSLKRFAERYLECGATQYGGMLAYSLFVSLIPLALGMLSLFGLFARDPRRPSLVRHVLVEAFPPEIHAQVRQALVEAGHHAGTIILLSIIGLAWFSSGLFSTAGFALNQIYGWPNRSFWRQRLLGMMLGAVMFAMIALAVGVIFAVRLAGVPGWVALVGVVLALTILITFLYRAAPSRRAPMSQVWIGATAASCVIVLAGYLLTVTTALTTHLGAGTQFFAQVFALAAWVYFIAQTILLGAFLNLFLVESRQRRSVPALLHEAKPHVGQLPGL